MKFRIDVLLFILQKSEVRIPTIIGYLMTKLERIGKRYYKPLRVNNAKNKISKG